MAVPPSLGIRAGNKPMAAHQRRLGERHGHNWYVPNVSRSNEFRHVASGSYSLHTKRDHEAVDLTSCVI